MYKALFSVINNYFGNGTSKIEKKKINITFILQLRDDESLPLTLEMTAHRKPMFNS